MAVINGNNLVLKTAATSGGTKQIFAHAQSASLSFSNALIDVTTKSSNSWKQMISGQKSFTISSDGLVDYATVADAQNFVALADLAIAGTEIFFTIGIGEGADQGYQGSAFISSIENSGGTDEAATYSISLDGTGALTKETA